MKIKKNTFRLVIFIILIVIIIYAYVKSEKNISIEREYNQALENAKTPEELIDVLYGEYAYAYDNVGDVYLVSLTGEGSPGLRTSEILEICDDMSYLILNDKGAAGLLDDKYNSPIILEKFYEIMTVYEYKKNIIMCIQTITENDLGVVFDEYGYFKRIESIYQGETIYFNVIARDDFNENYKIYSKKNNKEEMLVEYTDINDNLDFNRRINEEN